jgi:hypothetical protein
MILITKIETVYAAPDDDDYPDGESSTDTVSVGFRELVDLMREHTFPSCSHLQGTPWEWFSTEPYQDPYTGESTEQSIHYSPANPNRNRKYWRAAMLAAGYGVKL